MNNISVKAENVSKAYQTGKINSGTLCNDLEDWLARMARKKNKLSKLPEDEKFKGYTKFWALKNVSFEIEQGQTVRIGGENGAGKSTLLKIISNITLPTSGRITGKGRINSLLEIGTGFHPELTGRENIFLNGAMLGRKKTEINQKLDEIISFSGIEQYLDTPIKRYSSGMQIRLAFSAAVHLESEILILDEVLAVGDSVFQQKCMNKVMEINRKHSTTILLVNHNPINCPNIWSKEIILIKGEVR